jgi:hypothetical protein
MIDSNPNISNDAVVTQNAVSQQPASIQDQLAAAMAARPGRNRQREQKVVEVPGGQEQATAPTQPVVPEPESIEQQPEQHVAPEQAEQQVTPEQVSDEVSDVIEFLEFAKSNPKAKFRIPNKNAEHGYVELDADKAASILGQGSAIHEEQRAFKVREAEFNEYEQKRKSELDNLTLAMEFTVEPRLQQAYTEIQKTVGYNNVFEQQLAQTSDPVEQARIRANMEQNNRYIEQQGNVIRENRPQVEQFKQYRQQQVQNVLKNSREAFKDKELKNEYIYNELRDKLSKDWSAGKNEFVPGITNLDLVSSDEHLLSLVRDGMKFREGVTQRNAGGSLAAATQSLKRAATPPKVDTGLQERAKKGDKVATRDLLSNYLSQQRSVRKAS